MTQTIPSTPRKPLRLWPAVVIISVLLALRVLAILAPQEEILSLELQLIGVLGGVAGALLIVIWWLFFSRARWSDRIGALIVMAVVAVALWPLMHISIQNGLMGRMYFFYAIPATLTLAFVAWAALSQGLGNVPKYAALVVATALGCGVWALARTNGVHGSPADLEWRWTPTAEERLLARGDEEPKPVEPEPTPAPAERATPEAAANKTAGVPVAPPETPAAPEARTETAPAAVEDAPAEGAIAIAHRSDPPEWPGFRGPHRDSVVRGVQINTDWSQSPPVEIWRRPIGPGWSSFAVAGDILYTQEQRGEDEIVAAYRVSTGEPVWRHRDRARFYESNGGPGPRGTPAISNGRVYALGATGILNALDAKTGKTVWSRNAVTDTGVEIPGWGIASSPLVIDDLVIVAISGQLVAYDIRDGTQRWLGPTGGAGYSSPHLVTIDGVPQIVLLRGGRTISVAPKDGSLLWEHRWLPGVGIVQPAVIERDILIVVGDAMGGLGIRRISVTKTAEGWNVEERWTSRGLKPYFNDFVLHKGHAFGFDGAILSSINLEDGNRNWKGGRYGNGQMLLLANQDLLLVTSEDGELALVSATPDQYKEIARLPALNAKTWNHPVVIRNMLLVRNGEEMAAFRLTGAAHTTSEAR